MSAGTLSKLFDDQGFSDALNMLTLEYREDGSFNLLGRAPTDFQKIYPEVTESRALRPDRKFPYLEYFLDSARAAWETGEQAKSGPWIERDCEGREVALEVSATRFNERKILILKILGDNYDVQRNFLQMGRESTLMKQCLEEEVRDRTRSIREREEEIALRLVWAAESKDGGETGAHIRRIGLYSAHMAASIGWDSEMVDEIKIAATMHDVGKIAIPDRILRKPGKLTEEEFNIMKKHTIMGGRILSGSTSRLLHIAEEIALSHHEKWDGSGYPLGLRGEEIPVSARIVSIVDVYDALMTNRVYKTAWTIDDTIREMTDENGKRFDPSLFEVFLSSVDRFIEIAEENYSPLFDQFYSEGLEPIY